MEIGRTQEWDGRNSSESLPHFDEEWTVLTARPVVPLCDLRSRARRSRVLKLSAAFVLSILLGALAALLTASLDEPTNENTTIEAITEQESIAEAAPTPIEVWNAFEEPEDEPAPVLPKKIPIIVMVKPKTSVVDDKQSVPSANVDRLTDNSTSVTVKDQEPQPVVVSRFEERRLRRVFRRQRRERAAAAERSRDLMRIDEIFEGRRP